LFARSAYSVLKFQGLTVALGMALLNLIHTILLLYKKISPHQTNNMHSDCRYNNRDSTVHNWSTETHPSTTSVQTDRKTVIQLQQQILELQALSSIRRSGTMIWWLLLINMVHPSNPELTED